MKVLKLATLAVLCLALASCTSFRAWERAQEYEQLGEWDRAVLEYEKALEIDPDNLRYRMALQRARLEASRLHFSRGKELMAAGHHEMAALEFQLTVRLDPTNQFAAVEHSKAVAAVRKQSDQQYRDIDEMKRRVTEQSKPPILNPASNQPISLSFPKEVNVKEIYQALGSAFGINVMFDQRLTDDKITIELRNVTAQEGFERVMQAAAHFYKVLDEQTIIVIPDNAQTRREYEDLVIRTFYLSNGDAEQVTNVVRTMIEARNVFPLKALNAITIRDTADKVLIAERIIEANDKARAEVVVQVELLQVDARRLRDIGLEVNNIGDYNITPVGSDGNTIGSLPLDELKNLGTGDFLFNVPSFRYNLVKTASDAQLLARPQLRISEGESATLHIGQQVPIAVTTYNSIVNQPGQGGTIFAPPTSYQYRDVGIKIGIEPRVHHNREITLKLNIEVSNIQSFIGEENVQQPIIGTRTIESTIRLKDGETNFLAGLLRRDDTTGRGGVPFLSDLPLIGRLFANESKDASQTDLVLTLTPHIIRIADITEEDLRPMWVGTSQNMTFRGMTPRMEGQSNGDPFAPSPANEQFQNRTEPQERRPVRSPLNPQRPIEEPPVEQPEPESQDRPYESSSTDSERQSSLAELDRASRSVSRTALAPRISAQPTMMQLAPNDVAVWSLVGMDLDGLSTEEIVLEFSPEAIDITALTFGSALAVDPNLPPSISIDRDTGIVRIRSEDGQPLRFRAGGEIVHIAIQAVLPGDSPLVITKLDLSRADGRAVAATITGASATVEFN